MTLLEAIRFVLAGHAWRAAEGGLIFFLGIAVAAVVANTSLRRLSGPPLWVLRNLLCVLGPRPSLARVTGVIWAFNATAMFLYMGSGFTPWLPRLFAFWTGLNVALVAIETRRGPVRVARRIERPDGAWAPSKRMGAACGLAVLLLELPCFWFAAGMGIRMGVDVQAGAGWPAELLPRAQAYLWIIVPVLLASAAAESVAIRTGLPPARHGRPGEGAPRDE